MVKQIFIVTRQTFYHDRGRHYQLCEDNPVIAVYSTKAKVDDFFKRRMAKYELEGYTFKHLSNLSSFGLIEKYIVKHENDEPITCYNLIKDDIL